MVNDWTYAVEVYDENQTLLSVDTIEHRLRSVVHDVAARMEAGEEPVPIGLLSADDRDRWTEVRLAYELALNHRLTPSRTYSTSSPSPRPTKSPLKSSSSRSSLSA